jgi:hypothetical protein
MPCRAFSFDPAITSPYEAASAACCKHCNSYFRPAGGAEFLFLIPKLIRQGVAYGLRAAQFRVADRPVGMEDLEHWKAHKTSTLSVCSKTRVGTLFQPPATPGLPPVPTFHGTFWKTVFRGCAGRLLGRLGTRIKPPTLESIRRAPAHSVLFFSDVGRRRGHR